MVNDEPISAADDERKTSIKCGNDDLLDDDTNDDRISFCDETTNTTLQKGSQPTHGEGKGSIRTDQSIMSMNGLSVGDDFDIDGLLNDDASDNINSSQRDMSDMSMRGLSLAPETNTTSQTQTQISDMSMNGLSVGPENFAFEAEIGEIFDDDKIDDNIGICNKTSNKMLQIRDKLVNLFQNFLKPSKDFR